MKTKVDPAQADRFRAMAEELECDPDEAAFKAKLARIARMKPKDAEKSPPSPTPAKHPAPD